MPISQFAAPNLPMDSPFYRMERREPPRYKRGDYGPPADGVEYRERYVDGEWRRPDGSRAPSGTRGLGGFFGQPGQLNAGPELRGVLTWVALLGGAVALASTKYRTVALTALGGSAAFLIATTK